MAGKKTVTMKDIAAELHVSTVLVSYVLNGRGDEMRISKEMQNKVLQAARNMNYHMNLDAKRTRNQTEYQPFVSFFWPFQSNAELLNACFEGIHQVQQETRFQMNMQLYENNQLFREIQQFDRRRIHGAFLFCTSENDWRFAEEQQFQVPVVFLNRRSQRHSCAYIDAAKLMRRASELIAQAGYTEIGLLCDLTHVSHRQLVDILQEEGREKGFSILSSSFLPRSTGEIAGAEAIAAMIRENGRPPRLILSFSMRMARGADYMLRQEGYRCPEDVNFLVTSNRLQGLSPFTQFWSLIEFPIEQMVCWGMQKLLSGTAGQIPAPECREFPALWRMKDCFF